MSAPPTTSQARPALPWSLILSAVTCIEPDASLPALKRRAKLLYDMARARPWLSRWMKQAGPNALLRRRIERNPQLLGFVTWPYIHAGWPADRRFDALSEHLRVVDELYPWLALDEGERIEVLSLEGLAPGLSLEVDSEFWFIREGWLAFNLFLHGDRLMSIAFSLAREQGGLVARVGAIHGSNRPNALEVSRQVTRTLHGLRPRDFALKLFQLFLGAMGVAQLLCVADENRHHRHAYFGPRAAQALRMNYDEVWQENGGQRLSSGFFRLPISPAAKPLHDVPTRKRAMYRRRYEMLAELDRALRRALPEGRLTRLPPVGEKASAEAT